MDNFKDTFAWYPQNFRTSSEQPDCHKYSTMSEMYPALETYVSALSGGPIGPSDQIGTANATLIMATWWENSIIHVPVFSQLAIEIAIKINILQ